MTSLAVHFLANFNAKPWLIVTQRICAALLGGYALTALWVALLAAALARTGVPRSEAVVSAALLGFVLYLLVLLWAFSVRSLARLWAVLAGAGALGYGLLCVIR